MKYDQEVQTDDEVPMVVQNSWLRPCCSNVFYITAGAFREWVEKFQAWEKNPEGAGLALGPLVYQEDRAKKVVILRADWEGKSL